MKARSVISPSLNSTAATAAYICYVYIYTYIHIYI
jgi:hypothetical protein